MSDKSVLFIYLSVMKYYKLILDFGKEIHHKKTPLMFASKKKSGLKHILEINFETRVSKFEMQSQFE